jgi:hypothetical protein
MRNKSDIFLDELYKNNGNIEQTCLLCNIPQHLFFNMLERNTEFRKSVFLVLFELSMGNMQQACKTIGVSRIDIMKYAQEDEIFALTVWEITEGFIDLAESSLLKMGISGGKYGEGDSKALKTYLDAKAKNRGYGKIEISEQLIYPGLEKPEQKSITQKYEDKIKLQNKDQLKESLAKLKKLR